MVLVSVTIKGAVIGLMLLAAEAAVLLMGITAVLAAMDRVMIPMLLLALAVKVLMPILLLKPIMAAVVTVEMAAVLAVMPVRVDLKGCILTIPTTLATVDRPDRDLSAVLAATVQ